MMFAMRYALFFSGFVALLMACTRPAPAERPAPTAVEIRLATEAEGDSMAAFVLLPAAYHSDTSRRFPVLYLLHGYGGDHSTWLKRVPQLPDWISDAELIAVAPDGQYDSWYIDSPVDPGSRPASTIAEKLVPHVDRHFRTLTKREYRAVSGLSMGGHGAWWLALQYPRLFGAAGSMSGVMDISRHATGYGLPEVLGPPDPERYRAYSILHRWEYRGDTLGQALYFDCGRDDPFFAENQDLHRRLQRADVPHTFLITPGGHDWAYWQNALAHQLLFFERHFQAGKNRDL